MVDILPNEFSRNADDNTSFPDGAGGFLNLGEGCRPSNVNDGMRSLAASQAAAWGGFVAAATRPTDLIAHRFWRDTSDVNVHVIYYWDGFQDHFQFAVNPVSGGTVTSSILVFEDFASLAAAYVPAGTPQVAVKGRTSNNDGGFTYFANVPTDPGHLLSTQSADGQFWQGMPLNGEISNLQCGETGIGGDDTAVLNGTIVAATALKCNVLLIGDLIGNLDIGDGVGTLEAPPFVRGLGCTYNGAYSDASTRLRPFNDAWPIVSFNGVRRARISDIGLIGNVAIDTSNFVATGVTPTTDAYWEGIFGVRQRYSPPSAIAIDPIAGPTPPGGGYVGKTYLGSGHQSSDVKMNGLEIMSVDAGVVVQPGDYDANGDFPGAEDTRFTCVRDAWSVGNSQSRNSRLTRCAFNRVHTVVATDIHGRQNGRFLGSLNGCYGAGYIGRLVSARGLSQPGPIRFIDSDFESIHRLYDLNGNTAQEGHLVFEGGSINFRHESQDVVPGEVMSGLTTGGSVVRNAGFKTFNSTTLSGSREFLNFNASNVTFNEGAYVKLESSDPVAVNAYAAMFGFGSIDTIAPITNQQLSDGTDFVTPSAPSPNTTAQIVITSVVGDTVTFTGGPDFTTYNINTLIRDRDGLASGTCMFRTSATTARLITNFDFNTNQVLEAIPTSGITWQFIKF